MPYMTVELSIDKLAEAISHMTPGERESLALLLSEQGTELRARRDDILRGETDTVSEEEVFGE